METMFLLVNSLDEPLNLSVYDRHQHWKDSVLGSAIFQLSPLVEDAIQGGIHQAFSKDGKNKGELMFDVIYYPVLKPDEERDTSE
jgi:Ca2+-dependent lipid-binding protein, contains C2 domain